MSYEAEASYATALKVWWAMVWRIIPFWLFGVVAVGVVLAFLGSLFNIGDQPLIVLQGVLGLIVLLGVTLFVIRRLMTKGFGRYRLAVMVK